MDGLPGEDHFRDGEPGADGDGIVALLGGGQARGYARRGEQVPRGLDGLAGRARDDDFQAAVERRFAGVFDRLQRVQQGPAVRPVRQTDRARVPRHHAFVVRRIVEFLDLPHAVRRAHFHDLDQREPRRGQGLLPEFGRILADKRPCGIGRAGVVGQCADVVPRHGSLGPVRLFELGGGQPAGLAARHAVDHVVLHDEGEIQVVPGRLEQVLQSDRGAAVALQGDDLLVRMLESHADAHGQGDRPAVEPMDGMAGKQRVHEPRTADVAHDDDVEGMNAHVRQGLAHGLVGDRMTTARAVGHLQVVQDGFLHCLTPSAISCGVIMWPILLTPCIRSCCRFP